MITKEQSIGANRRRKLEVLVIDDHPVVRDGIVDRVNAEPDFKVCGHTKTAFEAQQAFNKFKPDVVILELALPDRHGLEFVKDIRAQSPALQIVIFTAYEESVFAMRALRAGANGFVMKSNPLDCLIEALRLVAKGNIAVNPQIWTRFLLNPGGQDVPTAGNDTKMFTRLTDRELEVFELIGKGAGTREIASYLNRSVSAVETCRLSIKEKLHVSDASELVCRAIRWVEGRKGFAGSLQASNAVPSN